MKRDKFKLYDVVHSDGPYKNCHLNGTPLSYDAARKLAKSSTTWPAVVRRTADRKWEDYVWEERHNNAPRVKA